MQIKIKQKTQINVASNPKQVAAIFQSILKNESKHDKAKEHFWALYLDSRNSIRRIELVSLGTLNAALVHPREVFSPALTTHAAGIIVSHNHPSGDPEPSEDDIILTKRLQEAGKILGIEVLDHVIIGKEGQYYSMKEKKIID